MDPQQSTPQAYNPYTMGMPTSPAPNPQPVPVQPAPVQPAQPQPVQGQSVQPVINPAIAATPAAAPAMTAPIAAAPTDTQAVQPNTTTASPIANAPVQPAKPQVASTKTTPADNPLSTQSTLLISELRDGLVIMKDGSFRAVIACQSINFDLMSESEREGVEYAYQNFLNSLSFTTQILIRSQRVDIGPYIERLTEIRKNNDNMLLGVLMDDYINFIDVLSQEANIMDKSFFIVIPYYVSAEAEKILTQTKNIFTNWTV